MNLLTKGETEKKQHSVESENDKEPYEKEVSEHFGSKLERHTHKHTHTFTSQRRGDGTTLKYA